ncbi:hypothetical protein ACLBX9_26250 [Methylobacterium sp. A49B]|nr:hypothetical protein [Parafilimonas terrae]
MGSDDCHQVTRSADVALEVLVRAYHALAVVYELASPGAYTALHDKMMPYLLDSFRQGTSHGVADPQTAELIARALERVRTVLDDVGTDVAAVRLSEDERNR